MGPRLPTACFAAGCDRNGSRDSKCSRERNTSAFGGGWVSAGSRSRGTIKFGGQTAQGPAETSARLLSARLLSARLLSARLLSARLLSKLTIANVAQSTASVILLALVPSKQIPSSSHRKHPAPSSALLHRQQVSSTSL